MKQVLLIHGGDVFETYEESLNYLKNRKIDFEKHGLKKKYWEDKLADRLGAEYQIIRPEMPNKRNARYEEWKIWFEKFFPFLNDELILVGSSLGALFVAKYLAENTFPKKLKAVFLIAGPFGDNPPEFRLLDFSLPPGLEKLGQQAEKIFLYHSKNDDTVPFQSLSKYQQALPKATVRVFEDRGHFNIEELPELVEDIRNIAT